MSAPKGFGKHYFTLLAIQAYTAHTVEQQCSSRVHAYTLRMDDEHDETSEDEEADALLANAALTLPAHAGHCNCYYRRITRNRILENSQPKLYISTHKFSNSVSSPPINLQPLSSQKKLFKKENSEKNSFISCSYYCVVAYAFGAGDRFEAIDNHLRSA